MSKVMRGEVGGVCTVGGHARVFIRHYFCMGIQDPSHDTMARNLNATRDLAMRGWIRNSGGKVVDC